MSEFAPIAIVGRSCLLPGAANPAQLWMQVAMGKDLLSEVSAARWSLRQSTLDRFLKGDGGERIANRRAGFVDGFEKNFKPERFGKHAKLLSELDPLFQWTVWCAQQALADASLDTTWVQNRAGLIMGHLGMPTMHLNQFARSVWLGEKLSAAQHPPLDRFAFGSPAQVAATVLQLGLGGYAIDAACASSLYAVKLACDRLQDGSADVMVAGGIHCTDGLFIHQGFTALGALSPTGQSRPFHRYADGLVPSEGAAVVVLKRLQYAINTGDRIHGVIRGIGLSNDGRSSGMLVPDQTGQVRAMRAAYEMAGLDPSEVTLMECHATGTQVGDSVELKSIRQVFGEEHPLVLTSLKSNIGHLITAAGAAGLIKLTEALNRRLLPPSRTADQLLPAMEETAYRILRNPEPWDPARPVRAAISAFGFGGNNAHMIVEGWDTEKKYPAFTRSSSKQTAEEPLAVVGISVQAGQGEGLHDFVRDVLGPSAPELPQDFGRAREIILKLEETRFPPNDLKQTLPQQLMLLAAAQAAMHDAGYLEGRRAGVYVGMEIDPEIARLDIRRRLEEILAANGIRQPTTWLASAADTVTPPANQPARTIGFLSNFPANRLNSQFDLGGPGFTVGAGEESGYVAYTLGARALRQKEVDLALVAAVDLSCHAVHESAVRALSGDPAKRTADAAVVIVLERLKDAERRGACIHAVLPGEKARLGVLPAVAERANEVYGESYAAEGLMNLATAIVAAKYGCDVPRTPGIMRPWLPSGGRRGFQAMAGAAGSARPSRIQVLPAHGSPKGLLLDPVPQLFCYAGTNRAEVLEALRAERQSSDEPSRLVFVAAGEATQTRLRNYALSWLQDGAPSSKLPPGMFFTESPMDGELAFVYTGAAAAYCGMGDRLLAALPELAERLHRRVSNLQALGGWIYDKPSDSPSLEEQLRGSSGIAQVHTELTLGLFGLKPDAVMGISSGETNSLFAMGAWQDMDRMFDEVVATGYYNLETAGEFRCARRAWNLPSDEQVRWTNLRVLCPIAKLREVLEGEPRIHIMIIHTEDDCLIGGDEDACRRALQRLGNPPAYPTRGHIVHCPVMREFETQWRKVHTRPTADIPGVRFYANALGDSYRLSEQAVADNLVAQAVSAIDFPRTVLKAYADGVRVFVEHGPRSSCAGWIDSILGGRRHLAVSLDHAGRSSVDQAANAIAALVAYGVKCDHERFFQRLEEAFVKPPTPHTGHTLSFPAHLPPVTLPDFVTISEPLAEPSSEPLEPHLVQPPSSQPTVQSTWMEPAPRLPLWQENPAPVQDKPSPGHDLHAGDAANANDDLGTPLVRSLYDSYSHLHRLSVSSHVRALSATLDHTLGIYERLKGLARESQPSKLTSYKAPVSQSMNGNGHQALDHAEDPRTASQLLERKDVAFAALAREPLTQTVVELPSPVLEDAPPAVEAAIPPLSEAAIPFGRCFTHEQLETHARGRISSLFGIAFAAQDHDPVQVRMPYGPMLLADRVTGLHAEPGVLGKGTIWTETDVREDRWFVQDRRVPLGVLMEAGQADLFLISYMGIDLLNQGLRRYRMLNGELTLHGTLPVVGDTLCYEIHIDSHSSLGDIRMFSFRFDCRVNGELRLTFRKGLAGFFTEEELAHPTGVLWNAETAELPSGLRFDEPLVQPATSYLPAQVAAFRNGFGFDCFGAGYEWLATHNRAPCIGKGQLDLFDEVLNLDPRGGPWQRGFVSAVKHIKGDEWFFDGHFKNDPCMAGTLMIESAQQVISFYMAALGYTLVKDGWRFEPIQHEAMQFRCQAQLTPQSKHIVYEVYIREVIGGREPQLRADVLGIIDGVKGLLGLNIGVQLVPDWPKDRQPVPSGFEPDNKPAVLVSGLRVDPAWMYHSTIGRVGLLSQRGKRFDGAMRTARLPCPPYLFLSRVTVLNAEEGSFKLPADIVSEYDVPADAWYFQGSQAQRMPLCVLMEVALQPCGWLSNHYGYSGLDAIELFYRNLDGTMELFEPVTPGDEVIQMVVKATSISRIDGMSLQAFEITGTVGDRVVLKMKTGFGYFSEVSLAAQVGITPTPADLDLLNRPSNLNIAVKQLQGETFARFPSGMLGVIDRITGLWPGEGAAGLGKIRAEKDVDPREWFFKAHFYTDPVMPGTLGIHSVLQLVEFYMLHTGLGEGLVNPFFQVVTDERPLKWKYRGQVRPNRKLIVVQAEITGVKRTEHSVTATSNASLWVDGVCVYNIESLSVRLAGEATAPLIRHRKRFDLDRNKDKWMLDHRPNMVVPVLPIMSVADSLAVVTREMNPARVVTALHDLVISRWIIVDKPKSFRTLTQRTDADGSLHHHAARLDIAMAPPGDYNWETVATCSVDTALTYPESPEELPPLQNAHPVERIYDTLEGFHGPSFYLKRSVRHGDMGASAILDAAAGGVPIGLLHPALLDCVYHSMPLQKIHTWLSQIKPGLLALPSRIESIRLYGETPVSGPVRCEVRLDPHEVGSKFISMRAQYLVDDRVWADIRLVNVLVDATLWMSFAPRTRWDYLRYRKFVPSTSFSEVKGDATVFSYKQIPTLDWIPGSVAALYRIKGEPATVARVAAIKEHVARSAEIHPAFVRVSEDLKSARPDNFPYMLHQLHLNTQQLDIFVTNAAPPAIEITPAAEHWRKTALAEPAPAEDLFFRTLCSQFIDCIQLQTPAAVHALRGRPVIYLSNQKTLLEKVLLAALLPPLTGTPLQLVFADAPNTLVQNALLAALGAWIGDRHPAGAVQLLFAPEEFATETGRMREILQTERLSMLLPWRSSLTAADVEPARNGVGALLEVAAATATPVVPVRIVSSAAEAVSPDLPDFPPGLGRLQICLGAPLMPETFSTSDTADKIALVSQSFAALDAIPVQPVSGDATFIARVIERMKISGLPESLAVLLECGLPQK